jgi:hypothetical protein
LSLIISFKMQHSFAKLSVTNYTAV